MKKGQRVHFKRTDLWQKHRLSGINANAVIVKVEGKMAIVRNTRFGPSGEKISGHLQRKMLSSLKPGWK